MYPFTYIFYMQLQNTRKLFVNIAKLNILFAGTMSDTFALCSHFLQAQLHNIFTDSLFLNKYTHTIVIIK